MSSSPFLARWLFRALLGAAFGRQGWRWFWREVPIYKPKLGVNGLTYMFKQLYVDPMVKLLNQPNPFITALNREVQGAREDFYADMMRYRIMMPPTPLTRTERLKRKINRKLHRLKPVLTTRGKIEDIESDY